ncbi:MAG: cytochrome ubiquinol oxidase subunit I [Pseudomonadota bacterium]
MAELDPLLLSRLQFALNISFHILFPSLSIGLGWLLFYFRVRNTISGDQAWAYAYHFWVKVFALTFALGVVSGIVMSFQFGTNWPGFMERAGNIAGPLLGYEVLTAFFLEASFLGIMLFGKNRVSNRVHLVASFFVAFGTTLSAFWILALNSWMQTPTGYRIENGQFFPESWLEIIFNPTFPYMFTHMMNASFLTAAFFVCGISALRIRNGLDGPATRRILRSVVCIAAVLAPLQVLIGDFYGLHVSKTQPAKVAALEAVWETTRGANLTLFGWPDETLKETKYSVEVPKLGSLILTHDLNGEVRGLNEFENAHPPVAPVFFAFRVMVGIGALMIITAWLGVWQTRSGREPSAWGLRFMSWMTFSGWIATLAGWYVTEIGRQPFIIYGQLRVADIVADHGQGTLLGSLLAYAVVYSVLLIAYIGTIRFMASKPAASLAMQARWTRTGESHG